MIYLISQSWLWLLLTAAFAAYAGWGLASQRAAEGDQALRRDRENLVRDLARLASGDRVNENGGGEREGESMRRLIQIRDGRVQELEQALTVARARADEAASRVAELERGGPPAPAENQELQRLRALVASHEEARAREVAIVASPAPDDESAELYAWRLRYFEQRVRYLEGNGGEAVAQTAPIMEWRARDAEARAAHLEQEVRALSAPVATTPPPASPFAANIDVDMLLRWRMLYLERRVAHLQENDTSAQPAEIDPESDRWKWRARYLEARVRHLEQRPAGAVHALAAQTTPTPERAQEPSVAPEKPAVLSSARGGAADDFTLIEDVSVLQQTTLYSIGVFHFDQIASWTSANIAWVDRYLRLRGRIVDEEWVEQAADLAHGGIEASRRFMVEEDA